MSPAFGVYRFLLLVGAIVLATFALGWIGVFFVAVGFAVIDRGARVPWETARAAAAAWGILFVMHLVPWLLAGAVGRSMVGTVAAAMGLPRVVPPLVTIVFPALLAWSAATVTVALLHVAGRTRLAVTPTHAAD